MPMDPPAPKVRENTTVLESAKCPYFVMPSEPNTALAIRLVNRSHVVTARIVNVLENVMWVMLCYRV